MLKIIFKTLIFCLLVFSLGLLASCSGNDPVNPQGRYRNGVFVVNEGSGAGSGDISFFDLDSNQVTNNLFTRENAPARLGTFVQSMLLHNDKAYIAVDNGNQVVIVNRTTFRQEGFLSLKTPHTMIADGNTGYITEWMNNNFVNPPKGRVKVVNLQTNTITDSISTDGAFPTRMVLTNNRLYVINSQENTVSVINTQTRQLEKKVVAGTNPNSIVLDANNDIWILTGPYDGSPARLIRYTPQGADLVVRAAFVFGSSRAGRLITNPAKDKLYYTLDGKVFELAINATALSTSPFISRDLYGIGINPEGTVFYGADAGDYASNGKMIRYNVSTRTAIDSATVGVVPNGFVFN